MATLSNVESLTQGEQAYRLLRRMIIECELAPGSSVTEPELTQSTGHGKAAVRSALARLSHDGLVTAVPRAGYRIAPLDIKDALDLTQLRLLTEPFVFRMAVGRMDPRVIKAARERYAAGYEMASPKSTARYLAHNREFKVEAARASGNPRLAACVDDVSEQIDRFLRLGMTTASNLSADIARNVVPICDAMLSGRGEEVERLATENILATTARILSTLFRPQRGSLDFFSRDDVASMLGMDAARAPAAKRFKSTTQKGVTPRRGLQPT